MAKIDKTYHDLLLDILQHGFKYEDPNRKNTIRTQIQDYTLVHKFEDGFPAVTTKKLAWKSVVGELIWFLRGNTNIKYLVDNNINIWNKDAYNWYLKMGPIYNNKPISFEEFKKQGNYHLGPIYGHQWRKYQQDIYREKGIDQISNLIKGLKETPMGTKHIVTAWNPAELYDMALPPCHWSFEILVKPLTWDQRIDLSTLDEYSTDIGDIIKNIDDTIIPKYSFILKWHQRSVDTFLGLPFNIASYALLAHIIGKMTNMIPEGIIGDLSNVHIYDNHMDAVKEQLGRDINKYDKCELEISNNALIHLNTMLNLDETLLQLQINNFKLNNYNSYPSIKADMIPYIK